MNSPDDIVRDADIETFSLVGTARTMSKLRKRGICLHGWTGPVNHADPFDKRFKCHDCGKEFDSATALENERHELRSEYL